MFCGGRSATVQLSAPAILGVDDAAEELVFDQLPVPLERVLLSEEGSAVGRGWKTAAEQDACALLGAAGLDGGEQLSLTLCDDERIREINSMWRDIDAPTDVLSFPMDDEQLLGDLVISLDTAMVQAKERSHSLRDELRVNTKTSEERKCLSQCLSMPAHTTTIAPTRPRALGAPPVQVLMVHGVLHLLGYDHETTAEDYEEMASAETKLLTRLGWAGQGLIGFAEASSEEEE